MRPGLAKVAVVGHRSGSRRPPAHFACYAVGGSPARAVYDVDTGEIVGLGTSSAAAWEDAFTRAFGSPLESAARFMARLRE